RAGPSPAHWMAVCRCARGRAARGREVITAIGGAEGARRLKARAQQPGQIRRVGMLIGYAEDDPETQARLAAFRVALEQLGWKEGRSAPPSSVTNARRFIRSPCRRVIRDLLELHAQSPSQPP